MEMRPSDEQRKALLAARPDLRTRLEQLVGAHLLTEDEFWDNHAHLLSSDAQVSTRYRLIVGSS